MTRERQKYILAFLSQRLKRRKEEMMRSVPGSPEHRCATISFDMQKMEVNDFLSQIGLLRSPHNKNALPE